MRNSRNLLTAALVAAVVVGPCAVAASAASVATGSGRAVVALKAPKASAHGACPTASPSSTAVTVVRGAASEEALAGFCVSLLPVGWVVQGVDELALTIAPPNARDEDPGSFEGKLAVMLVSEDEIRGVAPEAGLVGGVWGRHLVDEDHSQALVFVNAQGRWLRVQAPSSLGWDLAQLVRFAKGVTVLPGAVAGQG